MSAVVGQAVKPPEPATYVQNRGELLSHGEVDLRQVAIEIAERAIAAADPGTAVRRVMSVSDRHLRVSDRVYTLDGQSRIFVIGAGKATFPIAKAIDEMLGPRVYRGLVTCKLGQPGELAHIAVHHAAHPIPSRASLEAATRTEALLREVRPGDIVLSCFTGGSSALFAHPTAAITLEDKIQTNRVLLGCGANIVEINAVRKHLSQVKGGRLVRTLPPGTRLINLTVSDVIGDPLDCITDPSVPDSSTFADARATLDKYRLWDQLPGSVTHWLQAGPDRDETVRPSELHHLDRLDCILVRTDAACLAAAEAAQLRGFRPLVLSSAFEGESREQGRFLAAIAKDAVRHGYPVAKPCALIGGGETTVVLGSHSGRGGPNQEFAVSMAAELAGYEGVVALAVDTDGTDGPTEFAGALVDGTTARRARSISADLHKCLMEHDVTPVLQRLGDIVFTGATGTNVNDLKLVLLGRDACAPGRTIA